MDLKLGHYDKDGIEVIDVQGEIDMYTAPRLRELLINLVSKGSYQLVVNLDEVGFLDSTGLGVLVGGLRRVRATLRPIRAAAGDHVENRSILQRAGAPPAKISPAHALYAGAPGTSAPPLRVRALSSDRPDVPTLHVAKPSERQTRCFIASMNVRG